MPELTSEQQTLALAIVAAVAAFALLVAFVLALRLRKLRRQYTRLRGDAEERDLVSTLASWARRIDLIDGRVDGVEEDVLRTRAALRYGLQRFHLVRYDAFEDMGGRLSFSAALLDGHGDGIVITSINGRTETRTYAKPIRNLVSDHNLSEEEKSAIDGAMADEGRSEPQKSATR